MQHTDAGFTDIIGRCTRAFATVDAGTLGGFVWMLTAASSLVEDPSVSLAYDVQLAILPRIRLGMTTDGNVDVLANSRSLLTFDIYSGGAATPHGPGQDTEHIQYE